MKFGKGILKESMKVQTIANNRDVISGSGSTDCCCGARELHHYIGKNI